MIYKKLKALISEQFTVVESTITLESHLVDDLGVDMVELSMALEEFFHMEELSDDQLANLDTVEDLVEFIGQHADL